MSNLFKYTKRVLTSVLAAAVVLTAIPSTAFGAELPDEDIVEAVEVQEEAVAEVGEEATTTDGTGNEEEVIIEEGEENPDQYFNGIRMAIDGNTAAGLVNFALVTLEGDSITTPADTTSVTKSSGTITALDDSGTPSTNVIKIDSATGFSGYVVPKYGYTLNSDVTVTVKGQYTDSASADHDIASTDWSFDKTKTVDMSYLNGVYDWSKAIPVTISGKAFLEAYEGVAEAKHKNVLAIYITGSAATANDIPMKVTVDGTEKAKGYKTAYSSTNTTAIDLTTSMATTDIGDYDLSVALVDSTGEVKQKYTANATGNADPGTGPDYPDCMTTAHDAYAYYFNTTTGAIYFSQYGLKEAYKANKENGYTLLIAFTKKANPTPEYSVVLSDDTYVTVKLGKTGNGDEIKTVADKAKTKGDKDIIFKATAKNKSGSAIKKVEYLVEGSSKKDAIPYDAANDKFQGETSFVSATAGVYGIPYEATHTEISTKIETAKDNITLFVTTEEDITYKVPVDGAGKSLVDVYDGTNYASKVIAVGEASTGTEAKTGRIEAAKSYSFKVTPATNKVVESVTVKMITSTSSTNMTDITNTGVTVGSYGIYTIDDVKGAAEVTVRVKDDTSTVKAKVDSTSSTNVVVKEKKKGTPITAGGVDVASTTEAFGFVVEPNSGFGVKKVEYTMDPTPTEWTELQPVAVKASGAKEYAFAKGAVTGDFTIKVTDTPAVDVTKFANDEAVVTFNGETIADGGTIRAASSEELSFTVTGKNGATVSKVYIGAAGLNTHSALANPTNATLLESSTSTYKVGSSQLGAAKTLYVVTERKADPSTYDVKVKSTLDNKDVDALSMRTGGITMTTGAAARAARAEETIVPTFLNKTGTAIPGTITYSMGIPATSKDKIATIGATGKILTSDKVGTDKVIIKNEDKTDGANSSFPKITTYEKEIALATTPLSTLFDKIELGSVVAPKGATDAASGFSADSKTIRVDNTGTTTNIGDKITYSIYPYTTVNGKSTKGAALANTDIADAIDSVQWAGSPEVKDTVKPADRMYTLTPAATTAETAVIDQAHKTGTVDVTATVTFADGSTITTAPEGLTIADKIYGYFAIPTVTINGASTYNAKAINVETVGSVKTASVKWDVYKINTEAAFNVLTNTNASALPTYTAITGLTDDTNIKGWIADGSISLADGVLYADTKFSTDGIATATSGATSTVTAVKKGNTNLLLKATVGGIPVAANPIAVTVENNITTYTVEFSPKTATYDGLNEGGARDAKYNYPTFKADAPIKSAAGTLHEKVDDPTATTKHSTGFALTGVPSGTVLTLPGQEAFDATTVSPKVLLYGWKVGAAYKKIGDTVQITSGPVTIEPLWAYKYDGGISVYRYDDGVKSSITSSTIDLVDPSTVDTPVAVELAAEVKELDVEKGPTSGGAAQYKDAAIDTAGRLKLTETEDKLDASALLERKLKATTKLASSASVAVKFVDGEAEYTSKGTGSYQISENPLTVTTSGSKATYEIKVADVTVEEGQSKTVTASIKKDGGSEINWNAAFASVAVTPANKDAVKGEVTVGANKDVKIAGLKATSSPVEVKIVGTDANGNKGEGTFKVTVKPSSVEIIPNVSWTGGFSEDQTNGTIYLRSGVSNTITWKAKEDGAIVSTSNAFKVKNTTADLDAIKNKLDVDATLDTIGTSYGAGADSHTTTPAKLGISELTVEYTATSGITYEKKFPVVTYQSVTVVAPTTSLKDTYAVYKNGTALEADKNSVEKIVYERGKTSYTFDSSAYTTAWLATAVGNFDPYYWAAAVNFNSSAVGTLNAEVLDLGGSITKTAAEWQGATGGVVLAANFADKKLELTNIPDTITLSDETLSTVAADGTDVAIIKMGVTPYNSSNWVCVTGSDYDMYMLARGERSKKALNNSADYAAWNPGTSTVDALGYASTSHEVTGTDYTDPDTNDKDLIELVTLPADSNGGVHKAAADKATVTSGKSRTDTFTVAKVNDPLLNKKYVGKSKITVVANGGDYKEVTLYVNGEYKTGKKDADGNDIIHYMKDGSDVQNGVVIVQGSKHYYKDGARVNDGIFNDNGKLILINAGAQVTTEGRATYDAKQYYIGADGYVKTGLFTAKDGKQYLAAKTGEMITYKTTVDAGTPGKYTLDGVIYAIDTDDTAKLDKKMVNAKFEWTTTKPSKWELSNPLPTSDWKVTYNLEGESEKLYANGTVTATATPADYKTLVGVTEVTFTFAVPDLSGYYSDAKGTTALTADPAVWKFKFKGSTGLGEGISVEGLSDDDEFDYTGYAITPSFRVVDNETGATLVEKTDYTLKWTNNNPKATALPATATVTITGKGNYDKTAITRTFKIVDPTAGEDPTTYSAVKSVKVEKETITYDGTEKFPKTLTITLADRSKVTATWNGSDYDLSPDTANVKIIVSNNINKGKGNVTVYGSDFKKPAKTTFTIAAADVASLGDKLTVEPEAPVYTKSGAKAKVTVKFNGDELVEGRDYKLNFKYSNKKNAGTAAGSVYITGKNNFKGSTKNTPVSFDIQKLTISDDNVIVDAYAGVAPKSIKAKVYDSEGNEIAKTNYTIKVEKDGTDISTSSTKLVAGDEITVTVAGVAGSNADEETKAELDITIRTKLSSAKFNAKGLQKEFNGSEVKLDSTDMDKVKASVKINRVDTPLEYGTDYEIVGYKNNTKKGTMTVFVRATDSSEKVSGFGSFKVKIVPKPVKDADK